MVYIPSTFTLIGAPVGVATDRDSGRHYHLHWSLNVKPLIDECYIGKASSRGFPILDEELLAEQLAQLGGDLARGEVVTAACAHCDDNANRFDRIGFGGGRGTRTKRRKHGRNDQLRHLPPFRIEALYPRRLQSGRPSPRSARR